MEHIYFDAQLCSEIATSKEKSKAAKEQQITFGRWSCVKWQSEMPNTSHLGSESL